MSVCIFGFLLQNYTLVRRPAITFASINSTFASDTLLPFPFGSSTRILVQNLANFCTDNSAIMTTFALRNNIFTMSKHSLIRYALAILTILTSTLALADEVAHHGPWRVTWDSANQSFKLHHQRQDGSYRPIYVQSVPVAHYIINGNTREVSVRDFAQVTLTQQPCTDEMGEGTHYEFRFSEPSNGDPVWLTLHFWGYDQAPHLLTSLEVASTQELQSNYLAPIRTIAPFILYQDYSHNRILKIPFDNDGWVRYERRPLSGVTTSYEVTALYDPDHHESLVLGSVDHDHWKSAITVESTRNGRIEKMTVYSGASDSGTYDILPHGHVYGQQVSSARFHIGYDPDWRDALDAYADACTAVKPRRDNWPYGRPVGWMSWNVLESKNSYAANREIVQYYNDVLRPGGFANETGTYIISIDAWNNLSSQEERWLCEQADTLNMKVGTYDVPFTTWRDPNDLNVTYYESSLSRYTFADVVLRANGRPIEHGGALALDPTHPAVKARNAAYIRQKYNLGYRYFKLDFMTHGMLQADSYYNKNVHTAVEAYNEGMDYYLKQINKCEEPVYVDLSISPLFPYHHANGRRQTCDCWGTLSWSEFSVHALTTAWWTGRLYQYNDPDGLPMVGRGDQSYTTLAENRTRLTSGIISGQMLLADNFSLSDHSGYGNAELSQLRAKTLLTNPDINRLLSEPLYFRPLNGWNELGGQTGLAEPCLVSRGRDADYLVVFHFDAELGHPNFRGSVSLQEMGLDPQDIGEVRELWSGDVVTLQDEAIHFDIPARDCRIYRLAHRNGDGLDELPLSRPSLDGPIYTLSGQRVTTTRPGIYIIGGKKVLVR